STRSSRLCARSTRRSACSRGASVPNPKSVTKFGGVSTTLAALLLLGIAPTIPRRRALPASPNRPRLWQRTSDPGHSLTRDTGRRTTSGEGGSDGTVEEEEWLGNAVAGRRRGAVRRARHRHAAGERPARALRAR